MNFEKYLIAEESYSSSSGFLGAISRIPSEEIIAQNKLEVQQEIAALEAYADAIMGQLFSPIAMESTGEADNASRIAAKARMAKEKIKEGKQRGNQNMINQGVNELSSSMQELSNESKKAKDPRSKAKLWMVAKAVGAIIASVLLLLGAVAAGKALTAKIHANGETQRKAINDYKDAKIAEMRRQTDAEIQQIQRESEERSKKLDQLIDDMKANLNTVNQMRDQVNRGKSGQSGSSSRNVTVKMPDGTKKQMPFDEAMKSKGSIVIENYTAVDLQLIALEAMIEIDSTDLLMMNFAAMEATGDDGIDSASVEVVHKAKEAYQKLKSASNDAERSRASMELDSAAKEMVVESNKAKDPGSKARWKKVAKIVGGIAASVALLAGATALYKSISSKNSNPNPVQAAASMKNATSTVKNTPPKQEEKSNSQQTQQSSQTTKKEEPKKETKQTASQSSQSSDSATPSGANLTYAQKQEIENMKKQIDDLRKRQRAIIKDCRARGEDIDTTEGTDVQRKIADMSNAREALRKKLFSIYQVRYG